MKKYIAIIGLACIVTTAVVTTAFVTPQQTAKSETNEHPRIKKAIHEMEDALDYMDKAPHDFGGHKKEAMEDTRRAIKSLKLAMQYRANVDNSKH
jgi:hypothetical protein